MRHSNNRFKDVSRRVQSYLAPIVFVLAAFAFAYANDSVGDNSSESGEKPVLSKQKTDKDETEDPPYTPKTKGELKKLLSPMQFKVTQNEETEPAFRNKYWNNKKEGIYRCIVCEQSLFSSKTKYKSGTGWPSFYAPIEGDHVGYKTDFHLFYPRKEVHCSRCKAHLGHVFDDGPKETTGKRYCMNSAALVFEAADEKKKPTSDQRVTAKK